MRCLLVVVGCIYVSFLHAFVRVEKQLPPNPFPENLAERIQDNNILDVLDLLGKVTEWYEPHLVTVLLTLINLGDSNLLDRVIFDPRFNADLVMYKACKHLNHDIIHFLLNHPKNLLPEDTLVSAFRWALQYTQKFKKYEVHQKISYEESFQLWLEDYFKMLKIWKILMQKSYSSVSAMMIETTVLTEINNQLLFLHRYAETQAINTEKIVNEVLAMFMSNDAFPVMHTNRLFPSYWYGFLTRLMHYNHFKGYLKLMTGWPRFLERMDLSTHPVSAPSLLKTSTWCAPIYCISLTMQPEVFEAALTNMETGNDADAMTAIKKDNREVYNSLHSCRLNDTGVETHVHAMSIEYRDSVSVQAFCLLSRYSRQPANVRIRNALSKPRAYLSQIILKAASLAGLLSYEHLPLIHAASLPAEVCDLIDEYFPSVDLLCLQYPGEGSVLLVISHLRIWGSLFVRGLLYELLVNSVHMGCLGFLRNLKYILQAYERER